MPKSRKNAIGSTSERPATYNSHETPGRPAIILVQNAVQINQGTATRELWHVHEQAKKFNTVELLQAVWHKSPTKLTVGLEESSIKQENPNANRKASCYNFHNR